MLYKFSGYWISTSKKYPSSHSSLYHQIQKYFKPIQSDLQTTFVTLPIYTNYLHPNIKIDDSLS